MILSLLAPSKPGSGQGAVWAALFKALIPAILLGMTITWAIHRENLAIGIERESDEIMTAQFIASEAQAGPGGLRILYLRLRADSDEGTRGDVVLNGTMIGAVGPAGREAEDVVLEIPRGVVQAGENILEIRNSARGLAVENARLRNYFGQSRGLIKYILVPKDAERSRSRSGILAVGIFIILFLLAHVRPADRMPGYLRWISGVCWIAAVLLLWGAAVLPLFSRYRLLLSAKNLPLFIVLLNVSPLISLFRKFIPWLLSDLDCAALKTNHRKRLAVAILLPGVITLFFASYMNVVKRYFGGNYSRFLRIDAQRLEEFGPLFWTPLLFENSDFEAGSRQNWHPEGDAFQGQPVSWPASDKSGQEAGASGQGRYGIDFRGSEPGSERGHLPAGRLVSVPFVIRHGTIRFLASQAEKGIRSLGGRMVLEVDGSAVRTMAVGGNGGRMRPFTWDVRQWIGRTARVQIIIDPEAGAGSSPFSVDWFHYDQGSGIRDGLAALDAYDGQFNYFMAYDPFLSRFRSSPKTYELFIDEPAYRYGRIGFPLLVKAASLNNPRLYPKVIVWLIVLSHFAGAFFFLRILLFFGRHPLWTLAYLLVPGFYYSLHVGLPESVCMALCLAALWCYLQGRIVRAAVATAAALFFRETAAILILAIAADALFRKRRVKRAVLLGGSLAPYVLWKSFITWRLFELYGWKSFILGPADFTLPFAGIGVLLRNIFNGEYPSSIVAAAYYIVLITALFALSVYLVIKERSPLTMAFGLFSLLAVSLNYRMVWFGPLGGIRLTSEAFLFGFLAVLAWSRSRNRGWSQAWIAFCAAVLIFNIFIADLSVFFRSALIIW